MEPITKIYYDGLEEGKILATKCKRCGNYQWPPYPTCGKCSCMDMEWAELSGDATLTDLSVCEKVVTPPYHKLPPHHSGYVTLKEGPILDAMILDVENFEETHKKLPLPLKAEFFQLDGFKTVAFRIKK